MKTVKLYGIDLLTAINFEKIMSKEFIEKIETLDGFVALAPYGSGKKQCNLYNSPTSALLFDTPQNRNKAYNELSKIMQCAIILETAEVDEKYLR